MEVPQTAPTPFFTWGSSGEMLTPEQIKRRHELADALMARGVDASPIQSWTQGVARLADAAAGLWKEHQASAAQKVLAAHDAALQNSLADTMFGSSGNPSTPIAGGAGQNTVVGSGGQDAFASGDLAQIRQGAIDVGKQLGVDPANLLTAVSYETGGTLNPWQAGPTTQWGQHRGLIQWGEPQRAKYGVTEKTSPYDQMLAAGQYLKDAGVQPGMGLMDIYSAINAGKVGRYGASDAANGGAPGTVADKVNQQMAGHRAKAMAILGQQAAGGGGSNYVAGGAGADLLQDPGMAVKPPASWTGGDPGMAAAPPAGFTSQDAPIATYPNGSGQQPSPTTGGQFPTPEQLALLRQQGILAPQQTSPLAGVTYGGASATPQLPAGAPMSAALANLTPAQQVAIQQAVQASGAQPFPGADTLRWGGSQQSTPAVAPVPTVANASLVPVAPAVMQTAGTDPVMTAPASILANGAPPVGRSFIDEHWGAPQSFIDEHWQPGDAAVSVPLPPVDPRGAVPLPPTDPRSLVPLPPVDPRTVMPVPVPPVDPRAIASPVPPVDPRQSIAQAMMGAPQTGLYGDNRSADRQGNVIRPPQSGAVAPAVAPSVAPQSVAGQNNLAGGAGQDALAPSAGVQAVAQAVAGNPAVAQQFAAAPPAAQQAVAQAVIGNPQARAALRAVGDPYASEGTKAIAQAILGQAIKPIEYGFQTLPDGTILRTNPRTGQVAPVYQAAVKPVEVNGRLVDPVTGRLVVDYSNPQTVTVGNTVIDTRTGKPLYQGPVPPVTVQPGETVLDPRTYQPVFQGQAKPIVVNGRLVDPNTGKLMGDFSDPNTATVGGALVDTRTGKQLYQAPVPGIAVQPGESIVNPQTGQVLSQGQPKPVEINGRLVDPTTGKVMGDYRDPNYGFQTLPDGTVLRTDPRGGQAQPVYQGAKLPTYGVISKDQFGNEQYGWIDPQTKQVVPGPAAPQQGAGMAVPPGVDPKTYREIQTRQSLEAPTTHTIIQPDGSQVAVQWDAASKTWKPLNAPAGGNPVGQPKLTETQAKDVNYYIRGDAALKNIDKVEGSLTDLRQKAISSTPFGLGNYYNSREFQLADQAGKEFIAAILRKDSGAALTNEEYVQYGQMFLPRPGDTPEVIAQKRVSRQRALDAIKLGLGASGRVLDNVPVTQDPAARANPAAVISPAQQGAVAPSAAPPAAAPAAPSGVAQPRSKADYDALPPGTLYLAPSGEVKRKQ